MNIKYKKQQIKILSIKSEKHVETLEKDEMQISMRIIK